MWRIKARAKLLRLIEYLQTCDAFGLVAMQHDAV
jgi:hypothetical protein